MSLTELALLDGRRPLTSGNVIGLTLTGCHVRQSVLKTVLEAKCPAHFENERLDSFIVDNSAEYCDYFSGLSLHCSKLYKRGPKSVGLEKY
jgi:hypothetical protein